jgi:transposase
MARRIRELGKSLVKELAQAWEEPQPEWARKRLLVLRLVAQHELNAERIAQAVGISRKSVFNYLDQAQEGGVEGLLNREHGGGGTATLEKEDHAAFVEELKKGSFRRAKDAQRWIRERTQKHLALSSVYTILGKADGVLKVPRKTHVKKDAAKVEAFRQELPGKLEAAAAQAAGRKVRLWVLDEHRYGLLPVIRRCWAKRGVRVHAPYATRYQWGYLHEALEVDGDNRVELLFTPCIDKDIHRIFLSQIAATDPNAWHIVIQDQAGFHLKDHDPTAPPNLGVLSLPPYSPELNPVEKLGDLVKDAICNKLFTELKTLEEAILAELQPLRDCGSRVAQLIGEGWLLEKVNFGAQN